MDNYKLLNDYIYITETIIIDKENDTTKIKIKENLITDFLSLVRYLTKKHLNGADLDFDFYEFYDDLILTIIDTYDKEIDDITIDNDFVMLIDEELKSTT